MALPRSQLSDLIRGDSRNISQRELAQIYSPSTLGSLKWKMQVLLLFNLNHQIQIISRLNDCASKGSLD